MIIELKDGKTLDGRWQLVPVEPTETILKFHSENSDGLDNDTARKDWEFMLAAAPQYAPDLERCTHKLRSAGKPYPRTCEVCGVFGPCKNYPLKPEDSNNSDESCSICDGMKTAFGKRCICAGGV